MTSAIAAHCSWVGSQPVGLWAQACKMMTAFSGAFLKSSKNPSKSRPCLVASQYLYSRGSVKPAFVKTRRWFSGIRVNDSRIHSFNYHKLYPKLVLNSKILCNPVFLQGIQHLPVVHLFQIVTVLPKPKICISLNVFNVIVDYKSAIILITELDCIT